MSAIDSAFNDDESWRGRLLTNTAHLMMYAVAGLLLIRVPFYLGVDHWTVRVGELLVNAVLLVGAVHHRHTRLCIRCMREVPADASGRAQRARLVLWISHAVASRTGIALYLGLVIGVFVLVGVFGLPRVVCVPVDLFFVAIMYSTWLHHRLRPWCPYCRRWDDGGGIREPSPDPVGKATR